jgi:hypothetical protein
MPPTKQAAQADPAPTLSTPFQDRQHPRLKDPREAWAAGRAEAAAIAHRLGLDKRRSRVGRDRSFLGLAADAAGQTATSSATSH